MTHVDAELGPPVYIDLQYPSPPSLLRRERAPIKTELDSVVRTKAETEGA